MNLTENSDCSLGKIYSSDMKIANVRFPLLASLIQKQRGNARYYSEALKLEPNMICAERPGAFYNRYLYPLIFSSREQRDRMASHLLGRNIDTMKYLDDVVDIAARNYAYRGDCLIAQELSKKVLIIPNYHSLSNDDVEHIADSVNAGWAEISQAS